MKFDHIGEILSSLGEDLVSLHRASAQCPNKARIRESFRRYEGNVVKAMTYVRRLDAGQASEEELEDLECLIRAICKVAHHAITYDQGAHRADEWAALYGLCQDTLSP